MKYLFSPECDNVGCVLRGKYLCADHLARWTLTGWNKWSQLLLAFIWSMFLFPSLCLCYMSTSCPHQVPTNYPINYLIRWNDRKRKRDTSTFSWRGMLMLSDYCNLKPVSGFSFSLTHTFILLYIYSIFAPVHLTLIPGLPVLKMLEYKTMFLA